MHVTQQPRSGNTIGAGAVSATTRSYQQHCGNGVSGDTTCTPDYWFGGGGGDDGGRSAVYSPSTGCLQASPYPTDSTNWATCDKHRAKDVEVASNKLHGHNQKTDTVADTGQRTTYMSDTVNASRGMFQDFVEE